MKHSAPRGRQLKRLACLSTATVVLSLLVAPPAGVAQAPASSAPHPGSTRSPAAPNLKQVANLPKQAPFNTESPLNTDWAFQGKYAFGGNYNGFTVYDISNPRTPKLVDPGALPGLAERHLGLRQPALPRHRLAAHRRLVQQHRASHGAATKASLGGHQDLRHQRPAEPAVHQVGRDRLRLAHPDAGARARTATGRSTCTSRRTTWPASLPNCAAAARQDLDRQGAAARTRPPRPWWRRPVLFPDGGNPGGTGTAVRRRPAATTSPRTRRRTSRPAPAWVTASLFDISDRTRAEGHHHASGTP